MESRLDDQTRELARDGVSWRVREADTSRSPGSRGDRCLIFDAEGVVRRAWDVPNDWRSLGDDELWALLDRAAHPIPSVRDTPGEDLSSRGEPQGSKGGADMVAAAAVAAVRAGSLLVEARLMIEANQALRAEQRAMLDEARRVRRELRTSIQAYAEALRRDGVSPERALLLMKAAMHEGLRAQNEEDAYLTDGVVADGVAWGIAAYYAA
jgi:hypothetical protein